MNRMILFMYVLLFAVLSAGAQNALARQLYTEAENAFYNSHYSESLKKLKEVEYLLGSSNPRVLHLTILSQYKLFESNPFADYYILETTRANCKKFLATYKNYPDDEERYAQVLAVDQILYQYPSTKAEFELLKEQHFEKLRKEQEERRMAAEKVRKMYEEQQKIAAEIAHRKEMKEARKKDIQNAKVIGYSGGKFAPLGLCFYTSKSDGIGLFMSFRGLMKKDPEAYKNTSYRNFCFNAGITTNIIHPIGWYIAAGLTNFNERDFRNPVNPKVKDWGMGLDLSTGLIVHVIKRVKVQVGTAVFKWLSVPPEFCFGIGYGF